MPTTTQPAPSALDRLIGAALARAESPEVRAWLERMRVAEGAEIVIRPNTVTAGR